MLGMVFTELVEMVEDRFSPEIADQMLVAADLPHGGSYTAVGYYPHEEIVRLVVALSQITGAPVDTLVQAFGRHLAGVFSANYAGFFSDKPTAFDLIASIDAEIHREVRKLYPDAQLPQFEVLRRDQRSIELAYRSPRSMEALATGLLEGVGDFYRTPLDVTYRKADEAGGPTIFQVVLT